MPAQRKGKGKQERRDAGGPARKKGRSSVFRRLLYAAAFFLTLVAAGEVWAGAVILREGRSLLADAFGDGRLESASVDLFTLGVRLSGISIPQQGGFSGLADALEIESIDATIDWRMSLSPEVPRIRRMEVRDPTLRVLFVSSGQSGLDSLFSAISRFRGKSPARFDLRGVHVSDGTLLLQQIAPDRAVSHTLAVRGIAGAFERVTALPGERTPGTWTLSGRAGEAGSMVSAKGMLASAAPPLAFEVSLFSLEGLPMVEASPFVASLAGCRPSAGTLDLRSGGTCRENRLESAWVRFRLRGAILEGITPSGRELAAYVRSARGDVEEEFGLTGTWDAPEVRTGGFVTRLVWRKVGDAVGGILSLPLKLLESLAGGGRERGGVGE